MALKEFFETIDDEVSAVLDTNFEIEIIETKKVPSFDDSDITFDNFDSKKKKCKRLESCVLYVDIRESVKLSASKKPKTLAKVYSLFVRSMIKCARYYGGHVRNIIGDRVMVVFDQDGCFESAVDTAVLMNSVCKHILNKRIKSTDFKCGIGIDYGKMLITKGGAIRQGAEKEFYRGLVWLGKPANIASRLTDIAHKTESDVIPMVYEGQHLPLTDKWIWLRRTYGDFLDDLKTTHSRILEHKEDYFNTFFKTTVTNTKSYKPILMTQAVYDGYKKARPESNAVKNSYYTKQDIAVKDYEGVVYGGDVFKTEVEDI